MKCLLCRLSNQHAELMRHPNDTTFNSLQRLWTAFEKHDTASVASIYGCNLHREQTWQDAWCEEMGPKMHALMTKGVTIKLRRPA